MKKHNVNAKDIFITILGKITNKKYPDIFPAKMVGNSIKKLSKSNKRWFVSGCLLPKKYMSIIVFCTKIITLPIGIASFKLKPFVYTNKDV